MFRVGICLCLSTFALLGFRVEGLGFRGLGSRV